MAEVLIAGLPRSGTTFLFRLISGLPPGEQYPEDPSRHAAVKTHGCCPPENLLDTYYEVALHHVEAGGKVIFLYSDPVAVILSLNRVTYSPNNPKSMPQFFGPACGYHGDPTDVDLFSSDQFNLLRIYRSWATQKRYSMLALRYETLQNHFDLIEWYLERKLPRHVWRQRRTREQDCPKKRLGQIYSTYGELINLTDNAPDAWLVTP